MHPNAKRYSYEVRVGACADYLIGLSMNEIEHKWGTKSSIVSYWIRKRGCFKLRKKNRLQCNIK